MKIYELLENSKDFLDKNTFNELILYVLKNPDVQPLLTDEISADKVLLFNELCEKIKENHPVAYVINNKYFYESDFYVDERVLIPRIETELLVEAALEFDLANKNVLDLCCGSGCIGISLKIKEPTINLFLSDISKPALAVCEINLKKHQVQAQTLCEDYLDAVFKINNKLDFIVINPPYIAQSDTEVSDQAISFEPKLALFAESEGLYFYEQLFENLEKIYKLHQPIIICEFGYEQKPAIKNLFEKHASKYKIKFKKDYFNNPRYFILCEV
ncbi:N5-glutamine S-adenosyl-L-methionine-dependent methyltransferase [Spiroplasma clarkii]|uniref:peptide chain release factor N(5)-glutamine methyltransferase n=1 Tax=Spiroplasma clarkii TaxID=2139 RepID=A0A1Y0KYN0_9MOLU|nr:peptide chain release factor N(5)-glutamine methyltransferase [Spiroplasma clarkii]ARU90852.1 N5-glutamine S-adenosyl-L-methionine-dependent methyltransferase [Spiroplasma clarkii]ATX71639.1 N5-glutamine S-adenosyl-L-methionine-dependent methyltransferase [Spiroplasma clarkii]